MSTPKVVIQHPTQVVVTHDPPSPVQVTVPFGVSHPNFDALVARETVKVQAFGAISGGGAADAATNRAAIQAAIDHAKTLSGGRGATVTLRGSYFINEPIVLPRTGATPLSIVPLIGDSTWGALLRGTDDFPADRALIEWEDTASRAWHQRIENISFQLPNVSGVKAIWYKLSAASPDTATTAQMNSERLNITLHNIWIGASNSHHVVLIDLEGSIYFSTIEDVFGDPNLGDSTHDTTLLRFSHLAAGETPSLGNDIPGFAGGRIVNVLSKIRQGGYSRVISGRIVSSHLDHVRTENGIIGPGLDLINSRGNTFTNPMTEGGGLIEGQVRLTRCWQNTFTDTSAGAPRNPHNEWEAETAYAVGDRVKPTDEIENKTFVCTVAGTSDESEPTWPSEGTVGDGTVTWEFLQIGNGPVITLVDSHRNRFNGITKTPGSPAPTSRGTQTIVIDEDSTQNAFYNVAIATVGAPDSPLDEIDIQAPLSAENYVSFITVGAGATRQGDRFHVGVDPFRPRTPYAMLGANAMQVLSGGPSRGILTSRGSIVQFSQTTNQGWAGDIAVPPWVADDELPVDIIAYVVNRGSGSGDVRFMLRLHELNAGQFISQTQITWEVTITAGNQDVVQTATLAENVTLTKDRPARTIGITRLASHAEDTLDNLFGLIQLLMVPADS